MEMEKNEAQCDSSFFLFIISCIEILFLKMKYLHNETRSLFKNMQSSMLFCFYYTGKSTKMEAVSLSKGNSLEEKVYKIWIIIPKCAELFKIDGRGRSERVGCLCESHETGRRKDEMGGVTVLYNGRCPYSPRAKKQGKQRYIR